MKKMAEIEVKTNGYEISEKLQKVVDAWVSFLDENIGVKKFELRYWGDDSVTADCIMSGKRWVCFDITETHVVFCGRSFGLNKDQFYACESATWNDPRFRGKLFKRKGVSE